MMRMLIPLVLLLIGLGGGVGAGLLLSSGAADPIETEDSALAAEEGEQADEDGSGEEESRRRPIRLAWSRLEKARNMCVSPISSLSRLCAMAQFGRWSS